MKKLFVLCLLYILCPNFYGQIIQFSQTPAFAPLPVQLANFSQLGDSESAFIDVENDGDFDLILTGTTVYNDDRTELYLNDGFGNYSIDTTENFTTVESGTIDVGDVDNDGDKDVLISGILTGTLTKSTKLYLNDGNGSFTTYTGLSLFGTFEGDPTFVDWDGDNDLDIFYSASFPFSETRRYQNDGFGNFSLLNDTIFPSSKKNAFAFFDVDGDLDIDLLFSGQITGTNSPFTKLYLNDGFGTYSPDTNVFVNVASGSISVGDIDGDLDIDAFISGIDEFANKRAVVYRNDISLGLGMVLIDNLNPVNNSTSELVDLNMDGDLDLIVGGLDTNNTCSTTAYINDGFGIFLETNVGLIDNIASGDIDFTDVDLDGSLDLFITGAATYGRSSFVYLNNGTGIFQKVSGTPFSGVQGGAISTFDIDNDNDKDVIISGWNLPMDSLITEVYRNDGFGHFFLDSLNNIIGKKNGDSDYSDVDGDGDLDFVISGRDYFNNKLVRLYKNNGSGIFNLDPLYLGYADFSALEFGDSQNDSWEDLLISGGINSPSTWIAQNNSGIFSGIPSFFSNSSNGDVSFGDVDSDNDLDIFITGGGVTKLYLNDGSGNYTLSAGQPFTQLYNSSIELADFDGDTDMDMLQTGITSVSGSGNIICELYLNNGTGIFNLEPSFVIEAIQNGDLSLVDIDNDLDPDITILGTSELGRITKIYQNQGGLLFVEVQNLPFDSLSSGSIAYDDFDLDGDLDLILTGQNQFLHSTAKLYENTSCLLSYGNATVITCGEYTTPSGSQTFNTLGSYLVKDTLANSCGADSIIDINLTLLPVQYNSDSIFICYGSDFTFIDGSLATNVIANELHTSVLNGMASNGCDSVITELLIVPLLVHDTMICQGSNFNLPDGSMIYDLDSDTLVETILSGVAVGNCDSIVRTNILVGQFTTSVESAIACNDFYWPASGITYNASGNYDATFTGANGCDSIVTLYLTINQPTSATQQVTACDNYTWPLDGNNYTQSGQYTTVLSNAAGCDSVVTLDLVINVPTSGTDVVTACDSYTWINGNNYSASTTTPTWTLTNAVGCDSIVTLDLTIHASTSSTIIDTAIDLYTLNGLDYTVSGSYVQIIPNANGCDSIINLNLTVYYAEIDELAFADIAVYPNPSNGNLLIEWDEELITVLELKLLDNSGRFVKDLVTKSHHHDLSTLVGGVYYIKVVSKQGICFKKWVRY